MGCSGTGGIAMDWWDELISPEQDLLEEDAFLRRMEREEESDPSTSAQAARDLVRRLGIWPPRRSGRGRSGDER